MGYMFGRYTRTQGYSELSKFVLLLRPRRKLPHKGGSYCGRAFKILDPPSLVLYADVDIFLITHFSYNCLVMNVV